MAVKNYLKVFADGHTEATKDKPLFRLEDRTYAGYNPDVLVNGQWCPTSGGDELVTNGDFSEGTTGWAAVNSTLNNNGGVLNVVTSASYGYAKTEIVGLVIGQTYTVSFNGMAFSSANYELDIYDDVLITVLNTTNVYTSTGLKRFNFVANTNTAYLLAVHGGTAGTLSIDNISVYETEIQPETPYEEQFTYMAKDDKLATFLIEDGQPVDITFDDDSPSIVQKVIQAKDMVVVDKLKINNTEWLNDGVDYDDPDAIGANPVAKMYPDGTIVGSTDNGDYIKFPDGWVICKKSFSPAIGSWTLTGGTNAVYYSDRISQNRPIAYISNPDDKYEVIQTSRTSIRWTHPDTTSINRLLQWGFHQTTVNSADTGVKEIMLSSKGRWK